MRFLVDECTGTAVGRWLKNEGYEVLSIYDSMRGIDDDSILEIANARKMIIITNDKDFGEQIYREGKSHSGIILLRLENERFANKKAVLSQLLENYAEKLNGRFVVVTDEKVRFAKSP